MTRSGLDVRARAVLAALAGAAAMAAPAHACSRAPFPMFRDGVHLIATATADTVVAGPGGVRYGVDPQDPATAVDGPVRGQVVRLERVGGTDAGAIPAGTERVVLVPWGYGADCRTTRWIGPAAWVEPGTRGLLWGSLRPREQWVAGLPTLDVYQPYQLPYTADRGGFYEGEEGPPLSVEQAFELLGLLPTSAEYEADDRAAMQPFLRWAAANPALARRFPARMLMLTVEWDERQAQLARIVPAVAGTYRLTVTVDGDAPRTFYARTRPLPTTEWDPLAGPDAPYPPPPEAPLRGYSLLVYGAASESALAAAYGDARESEGYFSLLVEPEAGPAGQQVWRGSVEISLASRQFPADSALVRAGRGEWERYHRRSQAGEPEEVLARFVLRPDGSVSVEQTSVLDDGRVVVIRGTRVSTITLDDPR